jgi:hypothetical protein
MMCCTTTSHRLGICVTVLIVFSVCGGVSAERAPRLIQVADPQQRQTGNLEVEITKKGLGKEVLIRKGNKEWFMLIEVTTDNTVVVRQEKDHDTYLVDESETHDRAMTTNEVDMAIEDFINSVKHQAGRN